MKKYCSDCGIERKNKPTPGSCPCCFSSMIQGQNFQNLTVYTCTNSQCKRICTSNYLSGFWSGWREGISQNIPIQTKSPENIQCPVCGYYCLGKGGHGCIDKPSLLKGE